MREGDPEVGVGIDTGCPCGPLSVSVTFFLVMSLGGGSGSRGVRLCVRGAASVVHGVSVMAVVVFPPKAVPCPATWVHRLWTDWAI